MAGRGCTGTGADRLRGALLGLAAGDALGATLEFVPGDQVAARYGRHRDIVGGGAFRWRPGQGTDDTDLAVALARVYATGYTLTAAADAFLAWYDSGPRDIGGATAAGLSNYRRHRDPTRCGAGPGRAGNGSLMRALATGLVRTDPGRRAHEAAEISAITHDDPRCVDACIAYVDIVDALLDGLTPAAALERTSARPLGAATLDALASAPGLTLRDLRPTGYVLDTLTVATWALSQRRSLEDTLIDVVNLGGDADTTGAVAGGLLGAHHGAQAIPARWRDRLEYGAEIDALAPQLAALRRSATAHRSPST